MLGSEHEADVALARALQRGDEQSFVRLLERLHGAVVRLARNYVRSHALAEEIAQETWIGVIRGIHRYEGRSSLKAWIFGIAVNRAKERAVAEKRLQSLPLSDEHDDEPLVDPRRIRGSDDPWAGGWTAEGAPKAGDDCVESHLFSREVRLLVLDAIAALPDAQRMVITLRDVDGLSAEEVAGILGLSENNQRVLLHRARVRVRDSVARYFGEE